MICLAKIDPDDIWIYIYEKGEARYTDLINKFVNTGTCAKQTLINYKLGLESEGKIDKRIGKKTRRPVYYVPDKWKPDVRILMERREMMEMVDKLSPEELLELKKEMKEAYFGE